MNIKEAKKIHDELPKGPVEARSYTFGQVHGFLERDAQLRPILKALIEAHKSISKNTCCHCCGAAALVSKQALAKAKQVLEEEK